MSGIGLSDLKAALSDHTRTVSQGNWQVGAGATTTSVPVELVNPAAGTIDLSANVQTALKGATIEFRSGQNVGATRSVTDVSSSGTLTLDAALSYAPAQGDSFVLIQAMEISVTAPENVAQIGGQTVPGNPIGTRGAATPTYATLVGGDDGTDLHGLKTDTNGRIEESNLYASTGTAGAATPGGVIQVGGTDGTDLRALATDTAGVQKTTGAYAESAVGNASPANAVQISNFPTLFSGIAAGGTAIAANGTLASNYTAPANGTVTLAVTLASGATSSVLQASRNASAGTPFWGNLNNGTALAALNEFDANIPAAKGDVVNFRLVTATTIGWAEFFFVPQQ